MGAHGCILGPIKSVLRNYSKFCCMHGDDEPIMTISFAILLPLCLVTVLTATNIPCLPRYPKVCMYVTSTAHQQ